MIRDAGFGSETTSKSVFSKASTKWAKPGETAVARTVSRAAPERVDPDELPVGYATVVRQALAQVRTDDAIAKRETPDAEGQKKNRLGHDPYGIPKTKKLPYNELLGCEG